MDPSSLVSAGINLGQGAYTQMTPPTQAQAGLFLGNQLQERIQAQRSVIAPVSDEKEIAASNSDTKVRVANGTNGVHPPAKPNKLFDRYIINVKNPHLPPGMDVSGSFAITRDTQRGCCSSLGLLHLLIYLIQRLHACIFRRKSIDPNFVHGMVITGHNQKQSREHQLIIAHSVFGGIKTASKDFLRDKDERLTEMYIYVPRDPGLRALLSRYGQQTAYTPTEHLAKVAGAEAPKPKKLPAFSVCDMLGSFFNNWRAKKNTPRSARVIYRNALVVADLLLGNQILNRKNNVKSLYCTAYAVTVLQGSILVNSLTEDERKKIVDAGDGRIRTRDEIAQIINSRIKERHEDDPLSKNFWDHKMCKRNARFVLSSYAQRTMDSLSEFRELPAPAAIRS